MDEYRHILDRGVLEAEIDRSISILRLHRSSALLRENLTALHLLYHAVFDEFYHAADKYLAAENVQTLSVKEAPSVWERALPMMGYPVTDAYNHE